MPKPHKELADFTRWRVVKETPRGGMLVQDPGGDHFWLPKDAMEITERGDGYIDFTIPQSLAEEKGMV